MQHKRGHGIHSPFVQSYSLGVYRYSLSIEYATIEKFEPNY